MSIFNTIINESVFSPPKGIIYGPPGIGKTTFGATIQGSLLIDCEGGAGVVGCTRSPYLTRWDEINKWLQEFAGNKHQFNAVVIDSLDWLVRRISEHVTGAGNVNATLNKSHGGYGNGNSVLTNYIYQLLLPTFNRIVDNGHALILLAHATHDKFTDSDGVMTEKTTPQIPSDYQAVFVEWADFVCYAMKRGPKRILITEEQNKIVAKNRYGLPPEIEFSSNSFFAAIRRSMSDKNKE